MERRITSYMDKETQKKALEALERQRKQYQRQNDFNYERVSVTLPKGTKDKIKKTGQTVNGYINNVVMEGLKNEK